MTDEMSRPPEGDAPRRLLRRTATTLPRHLRPRACPAARHPTTLRRATAAPVTSSYPPAAPPVARYDQRPRRRPRATPRRRPQGRVPPAAARRTCVS